MKLLASLKPVHSEHPDYCYGTLAEIDWSTRTVTGLTRIPTASFQSPAAFMAPASNGIAVTGDRIYLAMWNFIVELRRSDLTVTNAVSHPWMADLHGLTTDGERLWVASTATESVLCLELPSLRQLWRWGPDEPILGSPRRSGQAGRSFGSRARAVCLDALCSARPAQTVLDGALGRSRDEAEHRYVHKTRSRHWRHHLNDVHLHRGHLYVTTKQWDRQPGGAIIRLDTEGRDPTFYAPPGSFAGMHDLEFVDGRTIVTESGANAVGWLNEDGSIHHQTVEPAPFFVRGLCRTPDHTFIVGFTPRRGSGSPCLLIEFDETFTEELARMDLSDLYPAGSGTAVHTLVATS